MTLPISAITLVVLAGASLGDQPLLWRDLFGESPVAAVTGNGGLTVGVDDMGRVVSCRWPSPGYHDQISYSAGGAARAGASGQGLLWGIAAGGRFHWMTQEEGWRAQRTFAPNGAPVIRIECTIAELGLRAVQTVFVHAETDVLVWRIAVSGVSEAPALCFFADLTPCTRLIPEAPIADWALDGLNDFAAFVEPDGQRVCHFRPRQPGAREWERARAIVAGTLPHVQWNRFPEGVWAMYGSANRVRSVACFDPAAAPKAESLLSGVAMPNAGRACAGQCASMLWIEPENVAGSWQGAVFLTFGKNHDDAANTLTSALQAGGSQLEEQTSARWSTRLDSATMAPGTHPTAARQLRYALASLFIAIDRGTGAIVRAPITQAPHALDWPRHGVWTTLALDLAGYHAEAERHLRFYLDALRDGARAGAPAGSLPVALYANGVEALPELLLERDAAAWLLGGLWRHGAMLEPAPQRAFFESVARKAETAALFLATWSLDPDGRVLPSYQPPLSRDGASTESLMLAYAGLESAARIAEAIEKGLAPPVRDALQEVQSAIQLQFYALDAPWNWPPGLAYWMDAIVPEGHWLRKPLHLGDTTWIPLSGEASRSLVGFTDEDAVFPNPDALAAALEIIAALR